MSVQPPNSPVYPLVPSQPYEKDKRVATEESIENASKCYLQLSYHTDHEQSKLNAAFIYPEQYTYLFGENQPEGLYIKIANKVYQTFRDKTLHNCQIDLNSVAYHDVKDRDDENNCIWASPFSFVKEPISFLDEVCCIVYPIEVYSVEANETPSLLTSTLENQVKECLNQKVLSLNQNFLLYEPKIGTLRFKITHWKTPLNPSSKFSMISGLTKFKFISGSLYLLNLIEEMPKEKISSFKFRITRLIDTMQAFSNNDNQPLEKAWKNGNNPVPLVAPFNSLANKVRQVFKNKLIQIGQRETIVYDQHWHLEVELTQIKPTANYFQQLDPNSNIKQVFELHPSHTLVLENHAKIIYTVDSLSKSIARLASFEIVDQDLKKKLEPNQIHWLSFEAIVKALKNSKESIPVSGHFIFENGLGRYLLKLVSATGRKTDPAFSNLWKFVPTTKINIYSSPSQKIEVVDTATPFDLKEVTIDVAIKAISSQQSHRLFFQSDDEEKTIIKEEELQTLFQSALPKNKLLHEKKSLAATSKTGKKIEFKAILETPEKIEWGALFHISDKTKVVFSAEKGSQILIRRQAVAASKEDIKKNLFDLGIGGVTDELINAISTAVMSRTSYKSLSEKLNQTPCRGFLLHGPPGTGKTLTAKNFAKIFGIEKENIKCYSGTDFLSKWVGESAKNIRDAFKDAISDPKHLHMIIVDEIDAVTANRSNAVRNHENDCINALLAMIDGVSKDNDKPLNNVIVIGLTNRKESIDPALLRPGRLHPHIPVDLPNAHGRKEIFQIHTREHRKYNLLADDVDDNAIAEMTEGCSGAFIQSLVRTVHDKMLISLSEHKVNEEEALKSEHAKITMKQFREAFDQLKPKESCTSIMYL